MAFKKLQLALAALCGVVASVNASSHFIMGGLSPIAYERIDPIVQPGVVRTQIIFLKTNF